MPSSMLGSGMIRTFPPNVLPPGYSSPPLTWLVTPVTLTPTEAISPTS